MDRPHRLRRAGTALPALPRCAALAALTRSAAQAATRLRFRDAVRAQLREGALIPPGLVNAFEAPPVQGVDAAAPSAAGSVPALSAGVGAWRDLFTAMKLNAAEVGAIGPDVCGPDAAANEAMLRQDEAYSKALDAAAQSRLQFGRGTFEINYVKAFDKVRPRLLQWGGWPGLCRPRAVCAC